MASHASNPHLPVYVTSELAPGDVLLGRGTGPNQHLGNRVFREEIERRIGDYERARSKEDQDAVVQNVINGVYNRRGRFLRKLVLRRNQNMLGGERGGAPTVYEIVTDMKVIVHKIKQAFRYSKVSKGVQYTESTEDGSSSTTTSHGSSGGAARMPLGYNMMPPAVAASPMVGGGPTGLARGTHSAATNFGPSRTFQEQGLRPTFIPQGAGPTNPFAHGSTSASISGAPSSSISPHSTATSVARTSAASAGVSQLPHNIMQSGLLDASFLLERAGSATMPAEAMPFLPPRRPELQSALQQQQSNIFPPFNSEGRSATQNPLIPTAAFNRDILHGGGGVTTPRQHDSSRAIGGLGISGRHANDLANRFGMIGSSPPVATLPSSLTDIGPTSRQPTDAVVEDTAATAERRVQTTGGIVGAGNAGINEAERELLIQQQQQRIQSNTPRENQTLLAALAASQYGSGGATTTGQSARAILSDVRRQQQQQDLTSGLLFGSTASQTLSEQLGTRFASLPQHQNLSVVGSRHDASAGTSTNSALAAATATGRFAPFGSATAGATGLLTGVQSSVDDLLLAQLLQDEQQRQRLDRQSRANLQTPLLPSTLALLDQIAATSSVGSGNVSASSARPVGQRRLLQERILSLERNVGGVGVGTSTPSEHALQLARQLLQSSAARDETTVSNLAAIIQQNSSRIISSLPASTTGSAVHENISRPSAASPALARGSNAAVGGAAAVGIQNDETPANRSLTDTVISPGETERLLLPRQQQMALRASEGSRIEQQQEIANAATNNDRMSPQHYSYIPSSRLDAGLASEHTSTIPQPSSASGISGSGVATGAATGTTSSTSSDEMEDDDTTRDVGDDMLATGTTSPTQHHEGGRYYDRQRGQEDSGLQEASGPSSSDHSPQSTTTSGGASSSTGGVEEERNQNTITGGGSSGGEAGRSG